jgi:hypothetical protein
LFQVAVVLVRRALGRVEQREACEGQMETLERLRGVREQVQQEDDNFIAEVRHLNYLTMYINTHTCVIADKPPLLPPPLVSPFHPHLQWGEV